MLKNMNDSINKIKEIKDDQRVPSKPIKKYLINKCKENNEFCELVNNSDIEKLFNYIYEEVRKKLNGRNGWIEDSTVYNIAESYFIKTKSSKKEKEEPNKEHKVINFKPKEGKKVNSKVINNQISIFDL